MKQLWSVNAKFLSFTFYLTQYKNKTHYSIGVIIVYLVYTEVDTETVLIGSQKMRKQAQVHYLIMKTIGDGTISIKTKSEYTTLQNFNST